MPADSKPFARLIVAAALIEALEDLGLRYPKIEGAALKELEKVYRVNENALKVRLFRARQRVLKAYEAETNKAGAAIADLFANKPVEVSQLIQRLSVHGLSSYAADPITRRRRIRGEAKAV